MYLQIYDQDNIGFIDFSGLRYLCLDCKKNLELKMLLYNNFIKLNFKFLKLICLMVRTVVEIALLSHVLDVAFD